MDFTPLLSVLGGGLVSLATTWVNRRQSSQIALKTAQNQQIIQKRTDALEELFAILSDSYTNLQILQLKAEGLRAIHGDTLQSGGWSMDNKSYSDTLANSTKGIYPWIVKNQLYFADDPDFIDAIANLWGRCQRAGVTIYTGSFAESVEEAKAAKEVHEGLVRDIPTMLMASPDKHLKLPDEVRKAHQQKLRKALEKLHEEHMALGTQKALQAPVVEE